MSHLGSGGGDAMGNNVTTAAIATLVRVRYRLEQAPDESLPNILAGLLPKLLRRLDEYCCCYEIFPTASQQDQEQNLKQQQEVEEKQEQKKDVEKSQSQLLQFQHVTGILSHALQRLDRNLQIPATPWMEVILPFLSVTIPTVTVASSNESSPLDHRIITCTFSLKFLQAALVRCNLNQKSILASVNDSTTDIRSKDSFPDASIPTTTAVTATPLIPDSVAITLFRYINVLHYHLQQQLEDFPSPSQLSLMFSPPPPPPPIAPAPANDNDTTNPTNTAGVNLEESSSEWSNELLLAKTTTKAITTRLEALRTLWFMASWLWLDIIALHQSMVPFQNWDVDYLAVVRTEHVDANTHDDEYDDEDMEYTTATYADPTKSRLKRSKKQCNQSNENAVEKSFSLSLIAALRTMEQNIDESDHGNNLMPSSTQHPKVETASNWMSPARGVLDIILDVVLFLPEVTTDKDAFGGQVRLDGHRVLDWAEEQERRTWQPQQVGRDQDVENGVDDEVNEDVEDGVDEEINGAAQRMHVPLEDQRQHLLQQQLELRQLLPDWMRMRKISQRGLSSEGDYRMAYRHQMYKEKSSISNNRDLPVPKIYDPYSWNEASIVYLKQLKYACLRCSIWPPGNCLFPQDCALLLALIATWSSPQESPQTKLAREYTNTIWATLEHHEKPSEFIKQLNRPRSRQAKGVFPTRHRVSLSLVCSLMILVLGDTAAAPILNRFQDIRSMWESILGPRPQRVDSPGCRNPLPATIVFHVIDFIASLLQTSSRITDANDRSTRRRFKHNNLSLDLEKEEHPIQGVELLLHLLLAGEPSFRKDNVWVMHLVYGWYQHVMKNPSYRQEMDEKLSEEFVVKLLEIATSHLFSAARWSAELSPFAQVEAPQQQEVEAPPQHQVEAPPQHQVEAPQQEDGLLQQQEQFGLPQILPLLDRVLHFAGLGVGQWFHEMRHWDKLVQEHRLRQKRDILTRSTAVQMRESAYNLISDLSHEASAPRVFFGGDDSKLLSFQLPALLFTCAELEPEEAKRTVVVALDSVLRVYQRHFVFEPTSELLAAKGIGWETIIAPLLGTLVRAACSSFSLIRLSCAKWTSELLSHVDPMSACTLAKFLKDDPAATVSRYIAQGSWYSTARQRLEKEHRETETMSVTFVDFSNDLDLLLLEAEVGAAVQRIVDSLGIPLHAAPLILYDFHFDVVKTIQSTQTDRLGTLQKVGVSILCEENIKAATTIEIPETEVTKTCSICYEEYMDSSQMYALPCHHEFCLECWKSNVKTILEENTSNALTLRCPEKSCAERVTVEDLRTIGGEHVATWRREFLRSFVQRSQKLRRFCPGRDCTMVAMAAMPATSFLLNPGASDYNNSFSPVRAVKCLHCKTNFCLACGEPPHIPARCEDMTKFHSRYSSSTFWVQKNTKPCPGCNAAVSKDGGCNAMRCSQCRADFCWLCLSQLDAHMRHECNRYDPGLSDLERYEFYSERYQAHDHGEQYVRLQIANLDEQAADLSDQLWNMLEERDITKFCSALEVVLRARRFLKHSYIYCYGNDSRKNAVFESYQGSLEATTEDLSRLTEFDLNRILQEGGKKGIQGHVVAIALYTEFVSNSMNRLLAISSLFDHNEDVTTCVKQEPTQLASGN